MKWRLVVTALLLVASFFSISSLTVEGSLVQIWATRYDGPSGGNDAARAIAVDARGAVYVTGRSMSGGTSENDYHYATIKYDIDGNQVWVARYDGGGDQGDDAQAIDIDGSGNVYVTGWSSRPASAMGVTDYATVKYDANGNQLWVARYSAGGGNSSNIAHAIMVDKLGNVYVTGQSELMGIGRDWATIKYDSNGNQLWVVRYDGPGHGGDEAAKLVVDGQGNVHVSGKVYGGSTTFFDHATVKYDANGNQLWAAIYDGPAHGDDSGGEIGLDSSGNLYVSFSSSANVYNNHYEYATIKYDTSGNRLWVARYDGGHVEDMAVDASGNAYVTGYGGAGIGTNDYVTINYDTNGNQRWVARYDGPVSGEDVPRAVSVDSSGNVYVTGNSQGNSADYGDYGTVKYSSNGSTMGVARYNGPGNGSDTGVMCMSLV
ncbi:MAG: hypothetical protein HW402_1262 [Dehalococcoidales bacterium]|nr:hypothetical protein [Dehalococcoidales bacterium]